MTFEEYCDLHNIRIKIVYNLTCVSRGFCYHDGEEYHVLINGRLGYEQQRKTTIHEIIHVMENHFYKPSGVSCVVRNKKSLSCYQQLRDGTRVINKDPSIENLSARQYFFYALILS